MVDPASGRHVLTRRPVHLPAWAVRSGRGPSMTAHRSNLGSHDLSSLVLLVVAGTACGQAAGPKELPTSPGDAYRIVNLGTFDQGMLIRTVNNAGEAVGGAQLSPTGDRAFIVTRSRLDAIHGLPDSDWSAAHGINDSGVVVGSSNTATSLRAFVFTRAGGIRDLGTLPGDSSSEAFGINRHNQIVGYSSGPGGTRAVLWGTDGKIQSLGALLPGDQSRALAVND